MSFDISSSQESLDPCLFIEASAGTGKTFVIEHYVVRLLLSSNISMHQLVLITFTKAVARELRRRLAKTISAAASVLHSGGNGYPYLEPYAVLGDEERRRFVVRLDEAASLLPQAAITTIHGFCDTLLELYSRQKGMYFERLYMTNAEQRTWMIEFIRNYQGFSKDQWRAIAKKVRYQEAFLLDRIADAIEDSCVRVEKVQDMFDEVRRDLQGIGIASALCSAAACFKGTMRKDRTLRLSVIDCMSSLEAIIQNGPSEALLSRFFGQDLNEYFSTPLVKSRSLTSEEQYVLQTVQKKIWPYIDQKVNPESLISLLSSDCKEAFESFLKKTGKKTPNLVVKQVKEFVQDEDFRSCASKNFSCVVVDEFQDTDALQWEIVEALFVKNAAFHGRLLFVGDPKQAIYGFRNADVYNYLSVKDCFSKECIRTLSVNHRAEEKMVLAQNALFCSPAQPWLFYLPAKKRYLTAPKASCGKICSSSTTCDRKAVHFTVFEGELGRRRRWPHDSMEMEQIFPWLSGEIVRLQSDGVSLQEMAVLVKDRFQAKHLLSFLQKRNIPATSWRADSVFDSPAYIWLQQALSLAANPEDRSKLSSLYHTLGAPQFLQASQMIAEGRLDVWAMAVHEWKAVRDAFVQRGIGGFARALFACLLDGGTTVFEYFLSIDDGDQFITDLEHLLELLSRLETMIPHSLDAFKEAFSRMPEQFFDDPSAVARRVDPDRLGITIVTMHASKGLEFPYVFALGCASRTLQNECINSAESDSEKFRLLYVSVTRAKKRCYLPILIEKGGKNPDFGRASPIELMASSFLQSGIPGGTWHEDICKGVSANSLQKLYGTLVGEFPDIFSSDVGAASSAQLSRSAEGPRGCLPYSAIFSTSVRYFSFTSSRRKDAFIGDSERQFREVPSVRFGILFHEAMAQLLQEPQIIRSSMGSIEAFLMRIGLQYAVPAEMLYRSVHAILPLHGEAICLADIPNEQMRVECAFSDLVGENLCQSGVIDLLIFRGGHVYIVDWKTQEVAQDCTEYFYNAGYADQARIYLEAARKAFSVESESVRGFFVFVRHIDCGGVVVCQ